MVILYSFLFYSVSFSSLKLQVDKEFGDLAEIEIWRDKSAKDKSANEANDDWYCVLIEVEDNKTYGIHSFPILRYKNIYFNLTAKNNITVTVES